MTDLSIIVLSFNTKGLLKDCLLSLLGNKVGVNVEIIVVDNNSHDGSPEMVERQFPTVKLIRNKENIGFGPGNNVGMKVAKGRYLLLLNSDTKIENPSLLRQIIDHLDSHPKIGIAGCALRNADGSYQGSGGYFPSLLRVFAWMFFLDDIPFLDRLIKPFHPLHPWSFFYSGVGYFKSAHQQDWVTGAFFLVRKEVVGEIGYFDEEYFAYVEEVEYCYRAHQADWEVWYLPKWQILHLGGASSNSEFSLLSEFKGLKLFYKKHQPKWKMPVLRVLLKAGSLLRIFLFGILKGSVVAKIYAKAFETI